MSILQRALVWFLEWKKYSVVIGPGYFEAIKPPEFVGIKTLIRNLDDFQEKDSTHVYLSKSLPMGVVRKSEDIPYLFNDLFSAKLFVVGQESEGRFCDLRYLDDRYQVTICWREK